MSFYPIRSSAGKQLDFCSKLSLLRDSRPVHKQGYSYAPRVGVNAGRSAHAVPNCSPGYANGSPHSLILEAESPPCLLSRMLSGFNPICEG